VFLVLRELIDDSFNFLFGLIVRFELNVTSLLVDLLVRICLDKLRIEKKHLLLDGQQ